jgi:hypothetical protein
MSNDGKSKKLGEISPGLRNRMQEEEERLNERATKLDQAQHGDDVSGSDVSLPSHQRHDYSSDSISKKKEFSDKVYLFPESFNALRRELNDQWPALFNTVNPISGRSLAWCMVFDAPEFIAGLNGALDMMVQYDTEDVDGICKQFLDALRQKRGVSKLH